MQNGTGNNKKGFRQNIKKGASLNIGNGHIKKMDTHCVPFLLFLQ